MGARGMSKSMKTGCSPGAQVESMLRERRLKKLNFDKHLRLPDFPSSAARNDQNWKVAKL